MSEFHGDEQAKLGDVLRSWCDRNEIRYRDHGGWLEATWSGPLGRLRAVLEPREHKDLVHFFVYPPVRIPDAALARVTELVARINWIIGLWCLELDCDDGTLRVRSSVVAREGRLEDPVIEHHLRGALELAKHYLPTVYAVAYGTVAPAEALAALPQEPAAPVDELN